GVPFPRGALRDPAALTLIDAAGKLVPLQTTPLAHWPDGCMRWLLLDFLIRALPAGRHTWTLQPGQPCAPAQPIAISEEDASLRIETGKAAFCFDTFALMVDWIKPSSPGRAAEDRQSL